MTVDPTKIFNEQEFQRRQIAEIEKRKASNAGKEPNHVVDERETNPGLGSVQPPAACETSIKDLMEQEMRQMLDKMREYKAKDPSLFSQIWEQVKKAQSAQPAASSSSTVAATTSPRTIQQKLPSLQGSPIISETGQVSSFPPDFDRGRFPYQSRRRGGSLKPTSSRSEHQNGASNANDVESKV